MINTAPSTGSSVLTRDRFNTLIDAEYEIFVETTSEDMRKTLTANFNNKYMTVMHDMYTDNGGHAILGASVAYISRDWDLKHVAMIASSMNGGHTASAVASVMKKSFIATFNVDIEQHAKFMISDTAGTVFVTILQLSSETFGVYVQIT